MHKKSKKEYIEVGAVTPYYDIEYRPSRIVDPYDKHELVTDHQSLFDTEMTGKRVLSLSTLEHVGTGDYGLSKREDCKADVYKILKESECCLITVPLGYNDKMDQCIRELCKKRLKRIKIYIFKRGSCNNKWVECDKKRAIREKWKYGPLWANSVAIVEKG